MKAIILKALKANPELLDGDGHSIMAPQYYIELGIPYDLLDGLDHNYKSGNDYKSAIFKNGQELKTCKGIYNLSFLYRLASFLDVKDYPSQWGRGSQAQVICSAIREKHNI